MFCNFPKFSDSCIQIKDSTIVYCLQATQTAISNSEDPDQTASIKYHLLKISDHNIVIFQYFPGRHVVNDLLARVSDWLSDVTQLTGDVWLSTVDNLQVCHLIDNFRFKVDIFAKFTERSPLLNLSK